MADVLSQHEIDSLLSEMSSGTLDIDNITPNQNIRNDAANYDFRRPNRISKNQVRTLTSVHEIFAETFGYYLVSKLQTIVSISVTSVDQLFYSEFILSVTNPSCIYVFDIHGTDGSGILEISPSLALSLVERLLGGSTDAPRKGRSITPIEQAIVRGLIDHALSDLRNCWRSIAELKFVYSRFETEADFVQIAPSSEIVVVVSFDVNIGMHSYLMNLCFPTFALEDILAKLNKQQVTASSIISPERAKENMSILKQQVSSTYLPVSAILGRASITVADLLKLKPNDVVKLDTSISQELEILIANNRKLAGRPGSIDGKKAVKITRELQPEDLIDQDILYKNEPKP
ncbi:MAG: flagellar motor switch protein FliM [Candidatus Kapabacteria bacterium]|jgi:flagellar motor switch protein FliM|nr:flagellar motor switch protein FliM [Candidatus Kapabacteria bacterium]